MTRTRWLGLVVVLLLVAGAFAYGASDDDGERAPEASAELSRLIAAAGLQPCPGGLGPALPDLTVRCLGGGPDVELRSTTPGLPTVLNVWGSWCAPCRAELPDFQDVADRLAGRVNFVGVDTADDDRSALSFAAFVGLRFPSVVDEDGRISAAFGQGTPKTVFLDARGKVRHVESGRVDSAAELEALVDRHLGIAA